MDLPAPAHGGGGGGGHGADEEDDHPVDERFDPNTFLVDYEEEDMEDILAEQPSLMDPGVLPVDYDGEEEMLANPNQQHQMFAHGVYNVAEVNNFIQTNQWNLLEQHIANAMPRSQDNAHPSLIHPTPFITIWRRQLMDLINGGRYEDSAQIFVEKVLPLKAVVTAYADTGKLSEEIAKIETSVGSRTSFAHAHCGTELMMKLINDYMRLYLPNVIGHQRPKGKQSALWEFALSLGVPVPGLKRHPHVRCLVCSVEEYTECRIGVDMTAHLEECPGMTPEAQLRYRDALKKGRGKKKRHGANAVDVNVSKAPKLTASPPVDPLHLIYQKLQDGKQVLDTMRSNIQQDVNLGINSLEGILDNIGGLVALAMQGQAAAPPPQAQAPILAQAITAAAVPRQAPPPAAAAAVPCQAPPPAAATLPVPAPALQGAATLPAPAPALQGAPQDAPAPAPALQGAPQDAPAPPDAMHGAAVPPPPPAPALQDGVPDYYSAFDGSEFLPELPEL